MSLGSLGGTTFHWQKRKSGEDNVMSDSIEPCLAHFFSKQSYVLVHHLAPKTSVLFIIYKLIENL